MLIILDAGHGGKDPGGGSNNLWKEKDMALKITLYQFERLKQLGVKAELTRDKDVFLTPTYRSMLVKNSKAKYCFSNHLNNTGDVKVGGFEIIKSITNESDFGEKIYAEMTKLIKGRRIFTRKNEATGKDYYFMHRLTGNVQTYIVEYGFARNEEDKKMILERWQELAEVPIKVLCEHEGIKYMKPGQKVKEDDIKVEQWKIDNLKYLHDNKMVDDFDGWLKKIDENMPAWAMFSILANMHKVLKGDPIKKPEVPAPKYSYSIVGTTHVLKVRPKDIGIVVDNKTIKAINKETAVNGTFFWEGKPNGILISDGKTLCESASHAWRGYPQSVLYCCKDGKVGIARYKAASEMNGNALWAIGGLGLIAPYAYDPAAEGFSGVYTDVLRQTSKTFIGYKRSEDMIYICVRKDSTHDRIIESCQSLKLDMAISLDGGGSSAMKVDGDIKVDTSRVNNNYIYVK